MGIMFMHSTTKVEPGTLFTPELGISDHLGNMYPPQPILILRMATHEEWVAGIEAERGSPMSIAEKTFSEDQKPVYFYQVSID